MSVQRRRIQTVRQHGDEPVCRSDSDRRDLVVFWSIVPAAHRHFRQRILIGERELCRCRSVRHRLSDDELRRTFLDDLDDPNVPWGSVMCAIQTTGGLADRVPPGLTVCLRDRGCGDVWSDGESISAHTIHGLIYVSLHTKVAAAAMAMMLRDANRRFGEASPHEGHRRDDGRRRIG